MRCTSTGPCSGSCTGMSLTNCKKLSRSRRRPTTCCAWACTGCPSASSRWCAAWPLSWPPTTAPPSSNAAWTSCWPAWPPHCLPPVKDTARDARARDASAKRSCTADLVRKRLYRPGSRVNGLFPRRVGKGASAESVPAHKSYGKQDDHNHDNYCEADKHGLLLLGVIPPGTGWLLSLL